MRIAIFLPLGLIIALLALLSDLPSYLSDEFITIFLFGILFVVFAFVAAGIIRE